MITRRTISFAVILMMLWSLVAPAGVSAGHCEGEEAVQEAAAATAPDDHHSAGHSHAEGEAGGDHHSGAYPGQGHFDGGGDEADHHRSHHDSSGMTGSHSHISISKASPHSYCCTDAGTILLRRVLDATTVTTSTTTWTVVPAAAVHSAFVIASVGDEPIPALRFKIGASPPWIAVAAQHTYQRTCLLLI